MKTYNDDWKILFLLQTDSFIKFFCFFSFKNQDYIGSWYFSTYNDLKFEFLKYG